MNLSNETILSQNAEALAYVAQLERTPKYEKPFMLLHFSDIHSDVSSLARIQVVKDYLGDRVDDTICTGDMYARNWTVNDMGFWSECDGKILTCIGNHEVLQFGEVSYAIQPSEEELYNCFFAPYIDSWNVTNHPEGKLYYYKDYADKHIRLIVLNALYPDMESVTAQNDWLAAALADAKDKEYTVVVAHHYYPNRAQKIPCTFSANLNFPFGTADPKYCHNLGLYHETIQQFIDAGGDFACILCGHKHTDYIAYHPDYPAQLCIGVGSALCPTNVFNDERGVGCDSHRINGEQSQDCMNVMAIDTVAKTIRIVRIGANMDIYMRSRKTLMLDYSTAPATVISNT